REGHLAARAGARVRRAPRVARGLFPGSQQQGNLINRGRTDEAGTLLRRALQVAMERGLTATALWADNNLAVVLQSLDSFEEMVALSEQALEMARRTSNRIRELSWR